MPKTVDYNNHGFDNINITDRTVIRNLEDALSMAIQDVVEFTTGLFNKVFLLHGENDDVVIKVSPEWNKDGLKREKWCYEQIAAFTKLRIAKIFSYFDAENDIFRGHEILAMENIPGHLLTHAEMRRRDTNLAVSQIFNEFHQVQHVNGYGWLGEDFFGEHDNWHNFLKEIDNIDEVLRGGAVSASDIDWLISEMLKIASQKPSHSFLVGDLRKENLIVKWDDGAIIPIDFQNCFVGDSTYDIGIGLFFSPEMLPFLKDYLPEDSFEIEKKKAILYAMRHALSCLGHRLSINNNNLVGEAVSRFNQLKSLYQSLA